MSLGLAPLGLVPVGLAPDEAAAGGDLHISATPGAATADGYTAIVDCQLAISATLGAATASGSTATIDLQLAVSATLGTSTAEGAAAIVDRQLTITATVGTASADGFAGAISSGLEIEATAGAAEATGLTAQVDVQFELAATLGAATAGGYAAMIGTLGTIARPNADVAAGGWLPSSGSDLFAMLDEDPADTADYIVAAAPATCELGLSAVVATDPDRIGALTYTIDCTYGLTVRLKCGATTIASWTHGAVAAPSRFDRVLSAAESAAITDYTDLRVEFESA